MDVEDEARGKICSIPTRLWAGLEEEQALVPNTERTARQHESDHRTVIVVVRDRNPDKLDEYWGNRGLFHYHGNGITDKY